MRPSTLVSPLKRQHRFTFILIQRRCHHTAIAQVHLAMRLLLEGQSMFHPFVVISLGEVFSGMGAAGFLAIGGCYGGLCSVSMSVFVA